MQIASSQRRIITVICGVSGPTIQGAIFGEKVTEYKMCFDFLYNLCLKHFSLKEELSGILS
jgi:hypothetical protein